MTERSALLCSQSIVCFKSIDEGETPRRIFESDFTFTPSLNRRRVWFGGAFGLRLGGLVYNFTRRLKLVHLADHSIP